MKNRILWLLSFIANCIGGYFLVHDWDTFLVMTGVITFNFLHGLGKSEEFKK